MINNSSYWLNINILRPIYVEHKWFWLVESDEFVFLTNQNHWYVIQAWYEQDLSLNLSQTKQCCKENLNFYIYMWSLYCWSWKLSCQLVYRNNYGQIVVSKLSAMSSAIVDRISTPKRNVSATRRWCSRSLHPSWKTARCANRRVYLKWHMVCYHISYRNIQK